MRPISEYTDYRQFVKDRFGYLKTVNPSFSYRVFSRSAGFGSPNYLKLIAEGKRNLGPLAAVKFATGLGLDAAETEAFVALVRSASTKPHPQCWHCAKPLA